jgi:hypothetical protein
MNQRINTNGKDYSIIEQAIEFLDHSIEVFYQKKYAIAVAIAGQSEEDFGKILNTQRRNNVLQIGRDLVAKDGVDGNKYNFVMNRTKNWLKHAEVRDKFAPVLHCDMELEAIMYIYRAISNYLDINGGIRETHRMFLRNLIGYREDFKNELKNRNINIEAIPIVD